MSSDTQVQPVEFCNQKTYRDKAKCPQGHKFVANRRTYSMGKTVATYCRQCARTWMLLAGPVPAE